MPFRDSASQLRDLAVRRAARLSSSEMREELVPLPVAAAIAYASLIGDPTAVRSTAVLEDRLEHIALALSAVATVYAADAGDELVLRKDELAQAIELLRRSGIAFSA